ncbi:Beta-barrel assembly machine subunit BamE [Sphaerotilus hippei]|uniref:Outer membrane protein assembly factor BamE n=1 Tax=Sphaerotilus hippei TaxID=744406 RepID=A0A318GZL3_9BURK|nr:outer membrane protein assembly factor BamE [Sphaerotilus hippei]PXW95833.1 Beta-barrel assembly machine subunit BamE [Sphaerotilus hippei]
MPALSRIRRPVPVLALLASVIGSSLLGACAVSRTGDLLGLITPYRVEVVQGNVVTREMAAQLRAGLTREQVRGLLGSPLLADVFHGDRWDYVFTIRRQGAQPQRRVVTVFFDADRVSRFDADGLPSEQEFVASIDVTRIEPRKTPLELDDRQLSALPLPGPSRAAAAAAAPASGPLRAFPPLESPDR